LFLLLAGTAFFTRSAAAVLPQTPVSPVMMVHFDYYPKDRERIRVIESRLAIMIKGAGVGEVGETELHVDGNDGYFYFYGRDPDRLYEVAKPILRASKLMKDAEVTRWYGLRKKTIMLFPGRNRVEY